MVFFLENKNMIFNFMKINLFRSSFFNSVSYVCGNDIFSLSELEYCIIKSGFCESINPSRYANVKVPSSVYTFAIKRIDHRLLFALNCGSLSLSPSIPIFEEDSIENQLESASFVFVNTAIKVFLTLSSFLSSVFLFQFE